MAYSLALIIIFGLGADYIVRQLRLPGLIGMLIAGVVAGPYILDLISSEMITTSKSLWEASSKL